MPLNRKPVRYTPETVPACDAEWDGITKGLGLAELAEAAPADNCRCSNCDVSLGPRLRTGDVLRGRCSHLWLQDKLTLPPECDAEEVRRLKAFAAKLLDVGRNGEKSRANEKGGRR